MHTCAEELGDLVSSEKNPRAPKARDTEAEVVMVALIASVPAGLTVFDAPSYALCVSDAASGFERPGTEGDHN